MVGVTGFEPATSTSQTRRAPVVLESKSEPLPILMVRSFMSVSCGESRKRGMTPKLNASRRESNSDDLVRDYLGLREDVSCSMQLEPAAFLWSVNEAASRICEFVAG